jgi:hypothetical protein
MTVKDVDEVGGTITVPIADWKAKQSRTNIRKVIRSIVMVPGTMRGTVSCNSLGRDEVANSAVAAAIALNNFFMALCLSIIE